MHSFPSMFLPYRDKVSFDGLRTLSSRSLGARQHGVLIPSSLFLRGVGMVELFFWIYRFSSFSSSYDEDLPVSPACSKMKPCFLLVVALRASPLCLNEFFLRQKLPLLFPPIGRFPSRAICKGTILFPPTPFRDSSFPFFFLSASAQPRLF